MRLGILVSGRGSNLEAVLRAVAHGQLPHVEPRLVISNRAGVRALEVAARHGVATLVLPATSYTSAAERDAAIGSALTDCGADLALLAGYDQLLRPAYFAAFGGRTVNVHPSLLPRHGGRGMIGLAVHRAVLAAGDVETGVTIHHVTDQLDGGPPLAQARLLVAPGESAEQLAERVLELEHGLLVRVLARLSAEPGKPYPSVSMAAAPPPHAGTRTTDERR
jgi:phosphoribosylglycinamide formyltransferase-1